MKKLTLILAASLLAAGAFAQQAPISIIPQPVQVTTSGGSFTLPARISIATPNGADAKPITDFLQKRLGTPTGYTVTTQAGGNATIRLQLNAKGKTDATLGKEGYQLSVTPNGVVIRANEPAGLFYGAQTLVQLFPPAIESGEAVHNVTWVAPTVEIMDYPRYAWRGLMLDVSRHFFKKEDVMAYIDQMSRYKFNLFHWHLTDDEGWRIEIKSLPNLTKKGAYNLDKTGEFGSFSPEPDDAPRTAGGYYTQEDVKEVIQYAKDRFVNILPEIEAPGHSLAAVASYPEISCTEGADHYQVRSGERNFMDWTDSGMVAHYDNTMCPANENTYKFLDKVFTEVAALFPFDYIHVGGDECPKTFWKKSDAVTALMKKEHLKTYEEVQSYFEKRVVKIVNAKGKKVIGWDEILEGGLAPGAAVMSWRGEKGGVEGTKLKHDVVMSPTTYAYLDYMQGDVIIEPRIYATLRLSTAYQFEPVPDGADPAYIRGGQANLWTENVYNLRHAEYMTWPRAFAISESVWTPKDLKSWDKFEPRVEAHMKRFDAAAVKYAPSMFDPSFTAEKDASGKLLIAMDTEVKDLDIYYSFDNSFPDRFYPKYTQPLAPPKDAKVLKVITYRGNQPMGRMLTMPIAVMQERLDHQKK